MRSLLAAAALLFAVACGSSSTSSSGAPAAARDAGLPDAPSVTPDGGSLGVDADAAPASDAGADAAPDAPVGAVLSAPADTWTWVPVAGMRCGNGSPTGVGLNPHAGATHLLLYLQGGGACYDAASCWGPRPTASYMGGYGARDFAQDSTIQASIFQRGDAGNPLRDATMVFVPYCTGDTHTGTGVATYTVNGTPTPTYFSGASNVDAVVAGVAASYPGLARVFLTGVSAGGFGTFLNQDAVARGLGGVPVDVIDDSGPAIAGIVPGDWKARMPPGCSSCTDAPSIFAYERATYPTTRYGFLTFQTDTTLPQFFGETDKAFAQTLATFVGSLASYPGAKSFVDQTAGHVVLAGSDPKAAPYILPWLTQLVTGDPAWADAAH